MTTMRIGTRRHDPRLGLRAVGSSLAAALTLYPQSAAAQASAPAPPPPAAPSQSGYPPAPPGYPQQQPGYPPAPPGYPQQQPGYPPAQPGYLPAPPPAPQWDAGSTLGASSQAVTGQRLSPGTVLLAAQTEAAFGAGEGSFYTQLVGIRLDRQFSSNLRLGAYLGYANLKGPQGRAHNLLPMVQMEHRLALDAARSFELPLRLATGYLPRNGPVTRLALGLSHALSDSVELSADIFAPTFWVTHDRPLLSLDLAVELAFVL